MGRTSNRRHPQADRGGSRLARVPGRISSIAGAAINDARVVMLLLILAAAALAYEMAVSFRLI